MAIFSKGIVLAQHKEPAFSKPIVRFVSTHTDTRTIGQPPVENPDALEVEEIIDIARAAAIVDERDGKLLYRKLVRSRSRAVAVVCDAVDDEPYVSSKISPLLKFRQEVAGALALCQRVAGTDNAFVMVYKMTTGLETRIPRSLEGYRVVRLGGGYPAEPHAGRLNLGVGRKLIVGAGALIHLYRAVCARKYQSTVFLTVAGNGISTPMNLEVSIGMKVSQVLDRCGFVDEPARVVCGGSMTGCAVSDLERTCVHHTTRAILAFQEYERDFYYNCIGCGRCEQVCPAGLNPMYIHRFVENSFFASLARFDAHLCTGCGTCSYICPSRLDVSANVAIAKKYAIDHFIESDGEGDDLED